MICSVHVTIFTVSCDLVTFTEEMLSGKLHFLCSVVSVRGCSVILIVKLKWGQKYMFIWKCAFGSCCLQNLVFSNVSFTTIITSNNFLMIS